MKFVIIGGDAAGMSAASRAKRNKPEMDVIVFEQTQDVSYSACGMPYNIADEKRPIDDLIVRQANVFREKQHIDLRTGHRVESIDIKEKTVHGTNQDGKSFSCHYDSLLIATGASPIIPELPGFDLPGVFPLKSLENGRLIKKYIQPQTQKAVIIGMGYIALEMAEAFHERGIEVSMIKPRPQLLPWLSPSLAEIVNQELINHQINLYPGYPIKGIEASNHQLCVKSENLSLSCDIVLTAIGVQPNSQIADKAGIVLGASNAIKVNESLKTSESDIFAAGDCADVYHLVSKKRAWLPLALYANRGGWTAADNVIGKQTKLSGIVGTSVFKVFQLEVARTGLNSSEAKKAGFDPVEVVIQSRSRAHAHPGACPIHISMIGDKQTGLLLGVQMIGKEGVAHRINAPAIALHTKMTVDHFANSDLAYAPPFSPVWDPMLTAANQLIKKMT